MRRTRAPVTTVPPAATTRDQWSHVLHDTGFRQAGNDGAAKDYVRFAHMQQLHAFTNKQKASILQEG